MTPSNGGASRKHLVSQTSVLSQPDLLSPDELFSQYTIAEIQRNHKKIQRDIESKRGELRTMVGEQYRELINTADTIADMVDTVRDMRSSLNSIRNSCKLERVNSIEQEEKQSKKDEFWSIASQMKLLVDTPEKIWNALENKQSLIAGQLYLLSRHIVTNLQIGNGSASQHLTKFPVLTQQWGAISHFKPSILQGCRDTLAEVSLSDDQFVDSLCTIILLEGTHLEVLVREVLDKRLAAVSTRLTAGGSVRGLLADCVDSIMVTVELIHNNMLTANRVTEKLKHLCHNVSTMEVVSEAFKQETGLQSITRHLPSLVHSYHPTVNCSLELGDVGVMCVDWCERVTTAVSESLHTTLQYVQSVSSVASLVKPYSQAKSQADWENICLGLLDKKIHIWKDILRSPVNAHVKKIVSNYVRDALQETHMEVSKLAESKEQADVGRFVWNSGCKKKDKLQQMAEGFMDDVQALCNDLNERLTVIVNDITAYTGSPETYRYREDLVGAEEIFLHIHNESKIAIEELANHIAAVVPAEADLGEGGRTDKVVLLVQICRCIISHTPQLQLLLTPRDKSKFSRGAAELYACIVEVKGVLLVRYGGWACQVLVTHLTNSLQAEPMCGAVVWEDVTVREETEGGEEVESQVPLPVAPSTHVSTLLFSLSSELYRIGSHALSNSEIPLLIGGLLDALVDVYDAWLESTPTLTQNLALQTWLDFKYLTAICNVSSSLQPDRNKKLTSVVRRVETHIDPFDWDVYQPHLTSNLHTVIRRTYNLYGAVGAWSTTVQAIAATANKHPFQQNRHNVLLGNEMVSRLPLLPLRSEVMADEEDSGSDPDDSLDLSQLCRSLQQFSSPLFSVSENIGS